MNQNTSREPPSTQQSFTTQHRSVRRNQSVESTSGIVHRHSNAPKGTWELSDTFKIHDEPIHGITVPILIS